MAVTDVAMLLKVSNLTHITLSLRNQIIKSFKECFGNNFKCFYQVTSNDFFQNKTML